MTKVDDLKAWRAKNPEKVADHQRAQYQKHREKRLASRKEYVAKNKDKLAEYARRRRLERTPEQVAKEQETKRHAALMRKYGISAEAYDVLLVKQGGTCAICPRTASQERYGYLNVDHDHKTGAVRGLLCTPCNHAIGVLGDTPEGLRRALSYLEK